MARQDYNTVNMGYTTSSLDGWRQEPAARPQSYWPRVSSPDAQTTQSAPTYVLITNDGGQSVGFCFHVDECTTSDGYTIMHNNAGASATAADATTNVKLDISPIAWSGSSEANVVFYYRGEI